MDELPGPTLQQLLRHVLIMQGQIARVDEVEEQVSDCPLRLYRGQSSPPSDRAAPGHAASGSTSPSELELLC